jgi:hypothetical protein
MGRGWSILHARGQILSRLSFVNRAFFVFSSPPPLPSYYCETTGLTTPTAQCPAGSYCAQGASAGAACTAGNYCPLGASALIACAAGTYCPANSQTQTACLIGNVCATASSQTACPTGCVLARGRKRAIFLSHLLYPPPLCYSRVCPSTFTFLHYLISLFFLLQFVLSRRRHDGRPRVPGRLCVQYHWHHGDRRLLVRGRLDVRAGRAERDRVHDREFLSLGGLVGADTLLCGVR